jgi:hypothetical protein
MLSLWVFQKWVYDNRYNRKTTKETDHADY